MIFRQLRVDFELDAVVLPTHTNIVPNKIGSELDADELTASLKLTSSHQGGFRIPRRLVLFLQSDFQLILARCTC